MTGTNVHTAPSPNHAEPDSADPGNGVADTGDIDSVIFLEPTQRPRFNKKLLLGSAAALALLGAASYGCSPQISSAVPNIASLPTLAFNQAVYAGWTALALGASAAVGWGATKMVGLKGVFSGVCGPLLGLGAGIAGWIQGPSDYSAPALIMAGSGVPFILAGAGRLIALAVNETAKSAGMSRHFFRKATLAAALGTVAVPIALYGSSAAIEGWNSQIESDPSRPFEIGRVHSALSQWSDAARSTVSPYIGNPIPDCFKAASFVVSETYRGLLSMIPATEPAIPSPAVTAPALP